MTRLCMSQRCQWHRCAVCSRIIFPHKKTVVLGSFVKIVNSVGCTSVSITPLCISQRCQWLSCGYRIGVNYSAVHATAVSMTPLCNQLCWFTPQIRSHIQKGFNPCIRGLGRVVWWKTTEAENLVSGSLYAVEGKRDTSWAQILKKKIWKKNY
jgi:hypothetical protein